MYCSCNICTMYQTFIYLHVHVLYVACKRLQCSWSSLSCSCIFWCIPFTLCSACSFWWRTCTIALWLSCYNILTLILSWTSHVYYNNNSACYMQMYMYSRYCNYFNVTHYGNKKFCILIIMYNVNYNVFFNRDVHVYLTCSFSINICCLASCCCIPYNSTPISSRVFWATLNDSFWRERS